MKICKHDEGNRTRLRQNHYKIVVEIIRNEKEETAKLLVDGFESVGAKGFEPPASCTPFNGECVHSVL